ncbi:hypothetical protein CSUI_008502, partial [Cystoisospora suis]
MCVYKLHILALISIYIYICAYRSRGGVFIVYLDMPDVCELPC